MNRTLLARITFTAVLLSGCGSSPPYQPAALPPPPEPLVVSGEEPAAPPPGVAEAQQAEPSTFPAPPPYGRVPYAAPPPPTPAPPAYTRGEWVHTDESGWLWVPSGAMTVEDEGVPYAYMYTPAYGWSWYFSPWGAGAYYRGAWVRHPWHPRHWDGVWVAPPHVLRRIGSGHHPHAR